MQDTYLPSSLLVRTILYTYYKSDGMEKGIRLHARELPCCYPPPWDGM